MFHPSNNGMKTPPNTPVDPMASGQQNQTGSLGFIMSRGTNNGPARQTMQFYGPTYVFCDPGNYTINSNAGGGSVRAYLFRNSNGNERAVTTGIGGQPSAGQFGMPRDSSMLNNTGDYRTPVGSIAASHAGQRLEGQLTMPSGGSLLNLNGMRRMSPVGPSSGLCTGGQSPAEGRFGLSGGSSPPHCTGISGMTSAGPIARRTNPPISPLAQETGRVPSKLDSEMTTKIPRFSQ